MNDVASPHRSPRQFAKTVLIIATCVAVPGALVGAGLALMSVMMFDAPGSENNRALILLASSFAAFPVACVVGIVCAWIAFAKQRYRGAVRFALLPLLPVISGIVAIVWLQVGYGGNFVR